MNCNEFKNSIKDYIEGRLLESKRLEFNEHLLSCEYCRRDLGEGIASLLNENRSETQKEKRQTSSLYFVLFILCALLLVISVVYFRSGSEDVGSLQPISKTKEHKSQSENTEIKGTNRETVSREGTIKEERDITQNKDTQGEANEIEDISQFSTSELKNRLSECSKAKDLKCISNTSMFLTKKTEGSERRGFRLMAIDALVEQGQCAAAMIHIIMLFKEDPNRDETYRAHLLNAKCYIKEKNFGDAEKILSMVEKEAPEFKDEIKRLRGEIKKGEKNGE